MMLTAALMAACSTEENGMETGREAVSIQTRITQSSAKTRANDDATTPYSPTNGATLTLCYSSMESGPRSTFTCTDGSWSTAAPLYWQDLKPNQAAPAAERYAFFAVAPQMPTDGNTGTVEANQSASAEQSTRAAADALSAFEASDLLMAYQTTEKSGTLDLNLKHLLSQLQVKLVSDPNAPDALTDAELATASLSINGLQTDYVVLYSDPNPTPAQPDPVPSIERPAVAMTTGGNSTGLKPYVDGTSATRSFRFIAPPQTLVTGELKLKFTLIVAGVERSYTYTSAEEIGFNAGAITQITVTANRTDVVLGSIVVTDWTTPDPIAATVSIDISGTPDDISGSAPAFSTMKLWKGQEDFTANSNDPTDNLLTQAPVAARAYSKDAGTGTWTADATPFYVDDVVPADRFYALTLNTTGPTPGGSTIVDATTQLNDPLAAGPAEMKAGTLALNYRHLLAKLRITLTAATNFTASLLTNATIATPAMLPAYTLAYSTVPEDNNAIRANATGTPAAYPVLSPATDYIVAPQIIATGAKFVVKLTNGNTYTATLTSDLELAPGEITTLALTLNPTQTAITVGTAEWAVNGSSTSKTISIDGITDASGSILAGDNPTDGDRLDISADGSTATGAYLYDANATAWTSTAPFYWDALLSSNSPYTFYALFTPTDGTNTDTGLVKDYRGGTATGVAFGSKISFSATHLMAQVRFTLQPGTGYDALTAGEVSVKLHNLHPLTGIATDGSITLSDDANAVLPLTLTDDNASNSNEGPAVPPVDKSFSATALVAPQTVQAGQLLVTVTIGANTYNYKAPTATGFAYQPGQQNNIILTVDKTGVAISFTLEDWGSEGSTTTGGGELVDPAGTPDTSDTNP